MLEAPFFMIISSVICIISFIVYYKQNFNMKAIIYLTFSLYLINLLIYIIFPIPYQRLQIEVLREYTNHLNHNYIPLKDISDLIKEGSFNFFRYIIRRVILFMPLGFYLPLIFKKASKFIAATSLGGILSIIFEGLKVIIGLILGVKYKIASIDLVIMYFIGTIIGSLLFFSIRESLNNYITLSDYTYKIRGN